MLTPIDFLSGCKTPGSLRLLRAMGPLLWGILFCNFTLIINSQITTTPQTRENEHLINVNKINTGTTTQSDPDPTDSAIRSTTDSGFLDSGKIGSTADPSAERVSPSASTGLNPTASASEISTGKEVTKAGTVSKPLPLTGSLPTPITDVSSLCPCDLLERQCDANCCCDPNCAADVTLFTTCLLQKLITNSQLCSQQAAVYSLNVTNGSTQSTFTLTDQVNPDVFCIQTANYESGLSFAPPEVPTDSNFDSLVWKFTGYFFSSTAASQTQAESSRATSSRAGSQAAGYQYADLIRTLSEENGEGFLKLPAAAATSQCAHSNPAAFLENQTTRCSRKFIVARDCTTLSVLNLQSYQDFRILSIPNINSSQVSISVSSISVQSLDGSRSLLNNTDVSSYTPELLQAGTVCNNVVLQVSYLISYNDTGAIVDAKVSFILGALNSSMVPAPQSLQNTFVQENTNPVPSSGNPGYVVGLPLVAGYRTAGSPIVLSTNRFGMLTIIKSSSNQDCLAVSGERTPVLFGFSLVSGCKFRVPSTKNCTLLSETILGVLRGQEFPQYVASFGNSKPQNVLDWVQIKTETSVMGCNIPLSLDIIVQWTKYGSLVNPQAQIVSVTEKINSFSLNGPTAGRIMQISSSVSFVDVSAAAQAGYKAPPTIDAKLPFNFFFPFV
ncbi:tectonic-1-like [Polyodon spathula]|uniref:tectonic-1-like n=1 Tax=Polyodon spathula TaxID=7913 RepID=UPI001B7F5100|nr:tectonic-1-like [Polyodon spathula]